MTKHFSGKIFGFRAISHAPQNVGIHALEIILVELREARRILLRRFDQKPVIRFFAKSLQDFSARSSLTQR